MLFTQLGKTLLAVICVGLLSGMAVYLTIRSHDPAAEKAAKTYTVAVKAVKNAKYIVRNMAYLKDTRTNICFAYIFGGDLDGNAIATVPCESVPSSLLITVQP